MSSSYHPLSLKGPLRLTGTAASSSQGDSAEWLAHDLLERFGRYVAVHTTSDPHSDSCPSTPGQWELARILETELRDLGLAEVTLTEHCYVRALLPANLPAGGRGQVPVIGFLAHLDTSPDFRGDQVKLQVHRDYQGGAIVLPSGERIDLAQSPALAHHLGKTILSSDGTTLLGADDKAGVAEIMTAVRYLLAHPELPHGDIEIIFTPDEEIGRGVDRLPRELVKSSACYTMDGDEEASYNAVCFNGWAVEVSFTGQMIHPGDARGRLVNPVSMAGMFIANLPRNESPEATDADYGFYCPQEIHGSMEKVNFNLFLRDFDIAQIERRLAYLRSLALTVEGAFPGGKVILTERKQYRNMYDTIRVHPAILERLRRAIADTGMAPQAASIRGGTDGARLSEMGIPTPNIFAGGHNFHSRLEWVPLESMVRASLTIINLAQLWAE
jgi:tripeptide aminopeptidase